MRTGERRPKKKRRLRKGRFLLFLLLLTAILTAVGWGLYHACLFVRETYENYAAIWQDFRRRQHLQTKFQDERFQSFTNILILGIDDGDPDKPMSGRWADAVIFASIRHADGAIRLLSIPPDTKVSVPGHTAQKKISQSYYYGGAQLALRTVEEFLEVPINHYVAIDLRTFRDLVDTLGGVELYVEDDMDYEDPYTGYAIHLKRGYQRLSGKAAEQYVRYRGDELGDVGRVQRQQRFLKVFYGTLLQVDAIAKLPAVADIVNRRLTTSMAVLDTAMLARHLQGLRIDSIQTEMLPGAFATEGQSSYWQADQVKLDALLERMFKNEALRMPEDSVSAAENTK